MCNNKYTKILTLIHKYIYQKNYLRINRKNVHSSGNSAEIVCCKERDKQLLIRARMLLNEKLHANTI